MLTSREICNFLIRLAADDLAPPLPDNNPPGLSMPPTPILPGPPDDAARIESLRTRLQALIGSTKLAAPTDDDVSRVFGDTPGEFDPEAEEMSEEWLDILRNMVGESDESDIPDTVNLRPR